jgi:PAS domain S-box-containing protein
MSGNATDRVRIEERLVMLAADIGTWRYDTATEIFYPDELARELFQLDADTEALSREDLLQHMAPESATAFGNFLTNEADITATQSIAIRIFDAEGDARFLVARARRLLSRGDGAGQLVGTVMDDTERQYLQVSLVQREAWLQTLVSGVTQSFMYMDKDQRIVFANDVFLRNTGWLDHDVRGKHLSEIHGPELYASRTHHIDNALSGETVSYEAMGKKGDGMGFFHHEFKPNFDATGNVIGIFATATDISDRHEIQQQLEKSQAELVRSNKDLEQFAYVASHDLKAPLRAIDVLVQWLREDLKDYDEGDVRENLLLMGQRTARLGRLLDDLLAYSRVGRKVGSIIEVNTATMIKDLVDIMGVPEGINVAVDGALPVFTTYAAPFEQVLRNLIGNAVKHHPGPTGKITVACEETDKFYVFSITDDGAGIPQEYAERVFQMFQTLKPRDEVEGSGMGLAIVSRTVEWQGGRVWFEPGPDGHGTVFSFQWAKALPDQEQSDFTEEPECRVAEK